VTQMSVQRMSAQSLSCRMLQRVCGLPLRFGAPGDRRCLTAFSGVARHLAGVGERTRDVAVHQKVAKGNIGNESFVSKLSESDHSSF
jgi:hypothetical protein